jgi:uncharacterized protein
MSDAAASAPAMTPTSASERIDVIDILRGLALFGILTANMRGFSAPAQVYFDVDALFKGHLDQLVQSWVYILVQGKFITLFSFLFGLGFAVQMDRARQRGQSVSFYPRRLFILLLFGLIHSWFIWWGDILVGYALTGFLLLLFRNAKQRTIALWAIALFSVPLIHQIGVFVWTNLLHHAAARSGGGESQGDLQSIQHAISIYRDGSYLSGVKQRFWDWFSLIGRVHILVGTYTLPRFLAGLWVWRTGVFREVDAFAPVIKKVWLWALGAGVLCDGAASLYFWISDSGTKLPPVLGVLAYLVYQISAPLMSTFYACSVVLACRSSVWKARLTPFGAVGRMALTNYIMQSLICTYFFRWTKLYGSAGPAFDLIPTVVLYSLQVVFSVWWLRSFQFGPLEWVWRSLTYGTKPNMRKHVFSPDSSTVAQNA